MNEFRERLLSGKPLRGPLLRQKGGKPAPAEPTSTQAGSEDSPRLGAVLIPREASRSSNHRVDSRHHLSEAERAVATWDGRDFQVQIVNLSGGGAMLEAPFEPKLWDRVDLSLAGCGTLECAVRWIKGNRLGLEFAHETQIDADPEVGAALLREVLKRSFPEVSYEASVSTPPVENSSAEPVAAPVDRGGKRHPLIWTGLVHYNHESTHVRLRNISEVGALVETSASLPVGAELLLDLGEPGSVFSTVAWGHGDQCGLRFHEPFNLSLLARAKPELTSQRWAKPDYLRDDSTETSPWASRWNRLTLGELKQTLGR
ncbi:PilZ domain-containing protein [Sphingomonas arenae]|uniref:PilZ domain-containing protein n=1 Tax=Sphingomonas arenae TaxID=2812555 RepID=UPI0019675C5F|nr:PilZ domain-containing protein [Sphingomonas arenae]